MVAALTVLRRSMTNEPLPPGHYFVRENTTHVWGLSHVLDSRRLDIEVGCPACERPLTLSAEIHKIGVTGEITPSLVCPFTCSWHVFARLEGWPPP